MTAFTFDHIHLRSPDPEATAAFYEKMFGATVHRSSPNGKPRVDLDFCGQKVFIAQVSADDSVASPPQSPASVNCYVAESIWSNLTMRMCECSQAMPAEEICLDTAVSLSRW